MKYLLAIAFSWHFLSFLAAQPNAIFSVDRYNICSGTTVNLNNNSTGANAYEWLIEGVHYSFSQDTTATLIEPCYDLKEIKLIASNTASGLIDSASIVVEVFDSCYFHWTGDYIACPGDTITMAINPEEIDTEFEISPPQTLLNGCLSCPSIQFVLSTSGTNIDRTSTYLGGCTEVTSYHYICNLPIEEKLSKEETFNLSPNPAKEHLRIETSNKIKIIEIYNLLGQKMLEQRNLNQNSIDLEISGLANNIYILILQTDAGQLKPRRFVKG